MLGPFEGKMFLVVKGAFSNWVEIVPTTSSTAQVTINKLRHLFASHGLPHLLVSDNASAFTGEEFQKFLAKNGIRHVRGAPYHPSTNGLAENAVRSFKEAMKKTDGDLAARLDRYLFDYRVTPHVTTGIPPCELSIGRKIRTRFYLLKPSLDDMVLKKQEIQARGRGEGSEIQLEPGDHVYYKSYSQFAPTNIPGTVESRTGPVSCLVKGANGQMVKRHFSQLFKQSPPESPKGSESNKLHAPEQLIALDQLRVKSGIAVTEGKRNVHAGQGTREDIPEVKDTEVISRANSEQSLGVIPTIKQPFRRSTRVRKPVERLITTM